MTNKKSISGNWIGAGAGIGAILFAFTEDPVWIAVGVALGAALDWTFRNKTDEQMLNKYEKNITYFILNEKVLITYYLILLGATSAITTTTTITHTKSIC